MKKLTREKWQQLRDKHEDKWLAKGCSINWWTIDGPRKLYIDVRVYGRIFNDKDQWDGSISILNGVRPGKYRIRNMVRKSKYKYDITIKVPSLGNKERTITVNAKQSQSRIQIRLGCWSYDVSNAYRQFKWVNKSMGAWLR